MNQSRLGRLGLVLGVALVAGCGASRVNVGRNVQPASVAPTEAIRLPVALYVEKDLRGYIEVASPTTLHGMNKTYQFAVGEALTPLLEQAVESVFSDVQVVQKRPDAETLRKTGREGLLSIGLGSAVIDLQFEPKFVGVNARTSYLLELVAELTDPAGRTLFRTKARGSGFSTVHTAEGEGENFVPGIDLALQEAVDRLEEAMLRSQTLRAAAAGQPVVAAAPSAPAPPSSANGAVEPAKGESAEAGFRCPPKPEESASARVRRAIKLLQSGRSEPALQELRLALCADPKNEAAGDLTRQIEAPVGDLFGKESFEYAVQPGDSLSQLADRFLGDPLRFYALARYNGIADPSVLQVGQPIRIPVTEENRGRTASAPASAPAPAPADVTPPTVAVSPPGGSYPGPVEVSLRATDDRDPSPSIRYTLDGTTPTAGSPRYTGPLRLEGPTTVRAVAIDRAGNVSRVRIDAYTFSTDRAAAEESYARGAAALDRGETEAAYAALQRAVELNPEHARARQDLERARATLVARYRKRATEAFRRQDLDGAIAQWDKVLEFDPGNEMATLERNRAQDLKRRLEKLGSQ